MPGLKGVLAIGVPIYTVLLTTMAWRAISRVQFFGVNLYNNTDIQRGSKQVFVLKISNS